MGEVSTDEWVALYDAAGRVIGSATRARMRAEGLWHAATAVLVRSGDGERVYVHRRTDTKDIYPGLHDCAAGGVVGAGEDPALAAARELAEEYGVVGAELTPVFTMPVELPPVRTHVFAYETRWDGPITPQESEIAEGWWMPIDELRTRLAGREWPFVPDGRLVMERWFALRG
ncbi:NUDIX hydrolase [Actinokineospora fastidiosa]|uniref:NUDIX hydrolase n=1 Tax=Actinokineospora fastidiosa TaxID=1816 RepID=A0A918GRF0_9PSEU|nr:NUDIX hydrolase [Actinokineospora fastidiosa]